MLCVATGADLIRACLALVLTVTVICPAIYRRRQK